MPTYYYEAMDATGQEIKDVVEAANQDEAQATIRAAGYFPTKIAIKKSGKRRPRKSRPQGQIVRPRRREAARAHHLHPPALHPARRRAAHSPQPEDSRTAGRRRG